MTGSVFCTVPRRCGARPLEQQGPPQQPGEPPAVQGTSVLDDFVSQVLELHQLESAQQPTRSSKRQRKPKAVKDE
jgi:hypothetical protein